MKPLTFLSFSFIFLALIIPSVTAAGDRWDLIFSDGTTTINGSDVCLDSGKCLSDTGAASGDISAVFAGTGLLGGGTTGDVTLNVSGETCSGGEYSQYNGTGFICVTDQTGGGGGGNTTEEMTDAVLGQANITITYDDGGDEWGVNQTWLDIFVLAYGFLTSFTEADPFWSDNFTLYNSSWSEDTDTDTWNTTEEMQDATGSGFNGTLIYDDANNIFYVNLSAIPSTDTDTWNTTEEMQDAVGSAFDQSLTYDDAGDEIRVNWSNATLSTFDNDANFITNDTMNKTVSCTDIIGSPDTDFCTDDDTGSGGASKWFDAGTYIQNNETFASNVNITNNLTVQHKIFASDWDNVSITESQVSGLGIYRDENNASFAENVSSLIDFCIEGGNCLSDAGVGSGDITSVNSNDTYILDYGTGDSGAVTLGANLSQFNDSYIHVDQYPNLDTDSTDDITVETDPLWTSNVTVHNDSWNSRFNQTYEDAWQYTTNGTFYDLATDPFGFYNSTDFDFNDFLLKSNQTLNGNYSASVDFCIAGGTCLSASGATETDPFWSDNFTLYNSSWSQDTTYTAGSNITLTGTEFAANMTGLQNWFDLFYQAIGTSIFGASIDDTELTNEDFGEFTCDGTEDGCTLNNDALDDQYYDSEADLTGLLDDNYVDVGGDTMTGNLSIGSNAINNGTVEARIFHNGTGWVIIG